MIKQSEAIDACHKALLDKYDRNVPRYTSYPTATHFDSGVNEQIYHSWISNLNKGDSVSLYFHIPFCQQLCWFCGCSTKIVKRYNPVQSYVELLEKEKKLITELLPSSLDVRHIHFGGGSPNILRCEDFSRILKLSNEKFTLHKQAEIAVEVDPRTISSQMIVTLAKEGVTRVSLGVQDVNLKVQKAINRIQPYEKIQQVVDSFRLNGIEKINFDLIYGLPYQSCESIIHTIDLVSKLRPDRISLFGYAHVPWMRRHQLLINETNLPDIYSRFQLYQSAVDRLKHQGYVQIGMDHFALPDDEMLKAKNEKTLKRNFQGYTTDPAQVLLGFGASSIGYTQEGYVQNTSALKDYELALNQNRLPVSRGIQLSSDDLIRREVIETLMCYLEVNLEMVLAEYNLDPEFFSGELIELKTMEKAGLVRIKNLHITIPAENRVFVRSVCSLFDSFLKTNKAQHSLPV